jgi:hypothetical protein
MSVGLATESRIADASMMAGVRSGFVTARNRFQSRGTMLLFVLAIALAISGGIIERRMTTFGAVDRSLVSTFRLVLPLFAFALTALASRHLSLREAAWSVARFGAARRDVALGIVLALLAASGLGGFLLAACAVLSAHNASSRPLLAELFTSGWIGALVAGAYAAWFVFGSTFFYRGRGRWVVLLLDLMLGAGTGAIAAFFPRAHARGLLGDLGPTHFSQPQSCVALLLILIVFAGLTLVRARD